MLLIIG